MATATIAKSEMRENHNLQVGYGEVPGFMIKGEVHYALPDGFRTTCKALAEKTAARLDKLIRSNLKANPDRLSQ